MAERCVRALTSTLPLRVDQPTISSYFHQLSGALVFFMSRRRHDPNLQDRLSDSAQAKNAQLAKFKQTVAPENPALIEQRQKREAIAAARIERAARREAMRQQQERERALAEQAAADAARAAAQEEARKAAEQAEREAALKAEQKAERDERYAARKAAKKMRRKG